MSFSYFQDPFYIFIRSKAAQREKIWFFKQIRLSFFQGFIFFHTLKMFPTITYYYYLIRIYMINVNHLLL